MEQKMMECPNCGEITLPSPNGGECENCHLPAYFDVPDMCHEISDLALHIGVPLCFEGDLEAAISRLVFKQTECGCTFSADKDAVYVSGYAEGADAECEVHRLTYPFSFSEDFLVMLEDADEEGCAMWHEWNDEDWDDVMEDDNRQRAADLNATLRDIGGGL